MAHLKTQGRYAPGGGGRLGDKSKSWGTKNNDDDLKLVEHGNNFIGSCSISMMLVDDLPSKDGLFLFG